MLTDLRLAFRTLLKTPGFTAIAVLTLALGIGLSTAAFSLTNVLLFRALPYPQSERLVRVYRTTPQSQQSSIAPGNALDIRAALTSFSAVGLFSYDALSLAEPDQPALQVNAINFSANFFNLLGVAPHLGRLFAPDEDQPGKSAVVVISHRFWPASSPQTRRSSAAPSASTARTPPSSASSPPPSRRPWSGAPATSSARSPSRARFPTTAPTLG
jgi:hypothetical protein